MPVMAAGHMPEVRSQRECQLWEKVTWLSKELEDVRDSNSVACEEARATQSRLETLERKEGKIIIVRVAASLQKRAQLAQAVEPSFHKVQQCLYGEKLAAKLWEDQEEEIDGKEETDDEPGAEPPPYVPAQREEPS
ncbi:hypothetical protein Y1Q_0017496 [Alligator mississippiensis]|uniref:Uncharacterized protein n=1 Tax=Alligator mississippiensis TaxID=8496 RepID=A0A151P257_ALLMI|nr:hypothetical protein Y1Q_0017496 [Alligator mississippiensis]